FCRSARSESREVIRSLTDLGNRARKGAVSTVNTTPTTPTTTLAESAEDVINNHYAGMVDQLQTAAGELRDMIVGVMHRRTFDNAAASDLMSISTALFDVLDVASQLEARRATEESFRAAFADGLGHNGQVEPSLAGLGEDDLREVTGALRGLWERYDQASPV